MGRFFGYGSLVNLATHDYADPRPAHLTGWRRVWRHTTLRRLAYLSVERAPGVEIDGIVADVPGGDFALLDARERAYARRDVTEAVRHAGDRRTTVVYEVADGHIAAPSEAFPIPLSYLDTVVQGFLALHGRDGADRFAATTLGWEAPVLDDRAAPLYPRAQVPTAEERAVTDTLLAARGAKLRPLTPEEDALRHHPAVKA